MKRTTIINVLCALSLLMLSSCNRDVENEQVRKSGEALSSRDDDSRNNGLYDQELDDFIVNPDMGFYRSFKIGIDRDGGLIYDGEHKALNTPVEKFDGKYIGNDSNSYVLSNLVHLMVDLYDYSAKGQILWDAYKAAESALGSKAFDKLSSEEKREEVYKQYQIIIKRINDGTNTKTYEDKEELNLDYLRSVFADLREKNKTAIVRFHYDPKVRGLKYPIKYKASDGKIKDGSNYYDVEPDDFKIILSHVTQICELLKDYTDEITAVECGMIRPWGEMHGTTYGNGIMKADEFSKYVDSNNYTKIISEKTVKIPVDNNSEYGYEEKKVKNIIEKGHSLILIDNFLGEMKKKGIDVPLLVRYPKTIYGYMTVFQNIDLLSDWEHLAAVIPDELYSSSVIYKLGMYNDGYLGTESDTGTYKMKSDGRNKEVLFLEPFLRHTGYGGELLQSDDSKSLEYYKTPKAAGDEMNKVHLSFLNTCHNKNALQDLDSGDYKYPDSNGIPLFRYILYNMGYKYAITNSTIEKDDNRLKINFDIKNYGFAEMPYHREKGYKVYLVKKGSEISKANLPLPAGDADQSKPFKGDYSKADLTSTDRSFSTSIPLSEDIERGEYDVYLKICNIDADPSKDGRYPVRLANKGIWNDLLKANKIGSIEL